MKIAFIGLGAMGFPMARNLAKDHEVLVWNRTTSVAEKHASDHGTTLARHLDDCVAADAIITCLPTSREVDQIVEQLAAKLREGTLWIDATSGDPAMSRETACTLAGMGIEFVDAPVSGGVPGADAGTLTFMVGGSEDGFRRCEEIARSMGKVILHVGNVGFGHAIKVITNTVMAANLWAASEALVSMKKMGFDMKTGLAALNASSGRSNVSENLLPMRIVDGKWPVVFKLALHDKDIRIATGVFHDQHISVPMLTLTSNFFTAARKALGEEADYIEIAKYVAAMNGESY